MSLLEYEVLSKIGESSYTMVFRVREITTNSIYALKKIRIGMLNPGAQKSLLASVSQLTSLAHPNLLTYRNSFFCNSNSTLCLILDLADNGDLNQKISQTRQIFSTFLEPEIWEILRQVLECTRYLHDSNILHRNLQASSIYLFNNGTIKVGDLGFVELKESRMMDAIRLTNIKDSPEVVAGRDYSEKSDVWGVGCIVYEMAMLKSAFGNSKNIVSNVKRILTGKLDMAGWRYSQELSNVMLSMLIASESSRPSCFDLLKDFRMPSKIQNAPREAFYKSPRLTDKGNKNLIKKKSTIQLRKINENGNKFKAYEAKIRKIARSIPMKHQSQKRKLEVLNTEKKSYLERNSRLYSNNF